MRASTLPLIAFFLILLFATYVRLDGITTDGLRYPDCFFYSDRANDWLNGNPTLTDTDGFTYIRPVQFIIGAAAQGMFGVNDYAISLLHGLLDVFNVLWIMLLATHFARSAWAGVGASLFYVGSDKVAGFARTTLGHVPSTSFLLLAFTVLALSNRGSARWKMFAPAVSGLALGLGAGIRSEFACFAPGFALAWAFAGQSRWSWKKAAAFSAGFIAPFVVFMLAFGWQTVVSGLAADRAVKGNYVPVPLGGLTFGILFRGIADLFSKAFAILWLIALASSAWMLRRTRGSDAFLSWGVLACILFAMLFDVLIVRQDIPGEQTRTLIPMGALICIFVGVWTWQLTNACARSIRPRFPWAGRASMPFYLALCATIGLKPLVTADWKVMRGRPTHHPRLLHDILKAKVSEDARVLIAPLGLENSRRFFANRLYFGNKAAYINDCVQQRIPIRQFLDREKIRYIYLADKRKALWGHPPVLGKCFGDDQLAFSRQEEERVLNTVIAERHGKLIFDQAWFGQIYSL